MKRVLIVDPSDADFQVAQNMLIYAGHKLRHCKDSRDLLELIRIEEPEVILLEFLLAGRTFLSVMRELKGSALTAHIPIISMSRQGEISEAQAVQMGAKTHIDKPYKMNQLLDAIQNI